MCVYDYALHRLNLTVHWWFILKHIRIFRASDNAKDIHKVLPAFVPCFIDFVASLTNACCKSTLALKTAYSIRHKSTRWLCPSHEMQLLHLCKESGRRTYLFCACTIMYNPSRVCGSMFIHLYSEDIQSYKLTKALNFWHAFSGHCSWLASNFGCVNPEACVAIARRRSLNKACGHNIQMSHSQSCRKHDIGIYGCFQK